MVSTEPASFCARNVLQSLLQSRIHVSAVLVSAAILLLSIALQLWTCSTRKRPFNTQCSLPPGGLGLPLVGETFRFLQTRKRNTSWEFADERVAVYGEIFKTHLLGNPTIVASNPAGNKMLFTNENKLVYVSWPASIVSVLGKRALIALRGDAAKRIRHAMMTFLRPEALQLYTGGVDKSAQSFIQEHWEGKSEVLVYPLMKRFTFVWLASF